MLGIIEAFATLEDPRRPNARHHKLLDILAIAFCASLCGAESCVDMAGFAMAKEEVVREFLDLDNGPPSHDTFSRVFRRLDPKAFSACFAGYLERFSAACKGHVAIVVKPCAARRTGPPEDRRCRWSVPLLPQPA